MQCLKLHKLHTSFIDGLVERKRRIHYKILSLESKIQVDNPAQRLVQ